MTEYQHQSGMNRATAYSLTITNMMRKSTENLSESKLMLSKSLTISIINYRTAELTISATESVLEALGETEANVFIVDNDSNDTSPKVIKNWITTRSDSRVRLIQSPINGGFSAGHNLAFSTAPEVGLLLLLNSDTIVRPGFFEAIVSAAEANPKAGMIAPQLEWSDGVAQDSCFRFAGPTSEFIRGAETGPVTKLFEHKVVAIPRPPNPAEIEWVSFACVLLRGEMIREIGPMDEGYFLYFEDAEYGLRAGRAGWGIVYEPRARVVHFRGGSGPVKTLQATKKRMPKYYWQSRTRFLFQAHGPVGLFLSNLLWIGGRVIAHTRRITGRPTPPAHEREWIDIWTGFLRPASNANTSVSAK